MHNFYYASLLEQANPASTHPRRCAETTTKHHTGCPGLRQQNVKEDSTQAAPTKQRWHSATDPSYNSTTHKFNGEEVHGAVAKAIGWSAPT